MIYTPGRAQREMIDLGMQHKRFAHWAQMGLGKTSATLTTLLNLDAIEPTFPALVVGPKRVALNVWPREVLKWDHLRGLRVSPVIGSQRERLAAMKRKAEIYTINYDNLPWLRETLGNRWPFRTVVADEATRLKNFRLRQGGERARSLARVSHATDKFIELTGTPSPNGLKDLWGQLWYLDHGQRLGASFKAFTQRWFWTDQKTGLTHPQPFAQEQIQARCSDICFSFRSKDYFDINEPTVFDIEVPLPATARHQYRKLEREFLVKVNENLKVAAVTTQTLGMKLSQWCQGAAYTTDNDGLPTGEWHEIHDAKLQALASIKEEAAGSPLLVAYWFKHDLERILRAFPDAVAMSQGPGTEDAWNRGEIPMLCVHYQSAGHGLNLQDGGNTVVLFTPIWDAELTDQVIERVGPVRQLQSGHDRGTNVYRILIEDSVDRVMCNRLTSKASVQNALMEFTQARKRMAAI